MTSLLVNKKKSAQKLTFCALVFYLTGGVFHSYKKPDIIQFYR